MSDQFTAIRQQVLRRVRYAANALALRDNSLPPEGPYDAALTNGLIAIVVYEWPGREIKNENRGIVKSGRELLTLIEASGGLFCVQADFLRDGLALTQPVRHGRADDEFAVILPTHVNAIELLDAHPALNFLDSAQGKTIDESIWLAFRDLAESRLPFDPKERFDVPEPEVCDTCLRPTFLPSGWDMFGGTMTGGECLACGDERSDEDALEEAINEAIIGAVERDD